MIQFTRATATHVDFIKLVQLLDADLKIRDGDDHDFYHQFNGIENLPYVVLAYKDDVVIACGALKEYNTQTFEIKRMYVSESQRGRGVASELLEELEAWSMERGVYKCVLETGINQPEAIGLYRKNHYVQIENYGQYKGVDASLCFEKILVQTI